MYGSNPNSTATYEKLSGCNITLTKLTPYIPEERYPSLVYRLSLVYQHAHQTGIPNNAPLAVINADSHLTPPRLVQ